MAVIDVVLVVGVVVAGGVAIAVVHVVMLAIANDAVIVVDVVALAVPAVPRVNAIVVAVDDVAAGVDTVIVGTLFLRRLLAVDYNQFIW